MGTDDSHTHYTDPLRLRADARHNRERILGAARATFATHGIDAP